MPKLQIKAWLELKPGDRLLYDCPLMSVESFEADRFFRKYHNRIAYFVGYVEIYVGFGDFLNREPGHYVNPADIRVVFEGETEERALNLYHFVLLGSEAPGGNPERWLKSQRTGDLPEPISFLPLDIVRLADDLLRRERRVKEVQVEEKNGVVSYTLRATQEERARHEAARNEHRKARVHSWFTSGGSVPEELTCYHTHQLLLVRRGSVSLLPCASPTEIEEALEDPSDALAFWTYYGRGAAALDDERPRTLEEAIERVQDGPFVFINDHNGHLMNGSGKVIDLYRANERVTRHLEHIRARSLAHWRAKLREEVLAY